MSKLQVWMAWTICILQKGNRKCSYQGLKKFKSQTSTVHQNIVQCCSLSKFKDSNDATPFCHQNMRLTHCMHKKQKGCRSCRMWNAPPLHLEHDSIVPSSVLFHFLCIWQSGHSQNDNEQASFKPEWRLELSSKQKQCWQEMFLQGLAVDFCWSCLDHACCQLELWNVSSECCTLGLKDAKCVARAAPK